jgi:hypothetical protein
VEISTVDIGIVFLIGILVGQWIILYALWRASMRLIEMLSGNQRSNKSTSSRSKAIFITHDEISD